MNSEKLSIISIAKCIVKFKKIYASMELHPSMNPLTMVDKSINSTDQMVTERGKLRYSAEPFPVTLCPPKIPHLLRLRLSCGTALHRSGFLSSSDETDTGVNAVDCKASLLEINSS
jgi:hypothetical protein